MHERLRTINMLVLTVVVLYTIATQRVLAQTNLTPIIANGLLFVTSLGAYKVLISIVYWLIGASEFLLRAYWGKQYVAGIWTYFYTVDSSDGSDGQVYFGVWKFEQDLFTTTVTGFGLTETFIARSHVNSVTDMMERNGCFEIINQRSDLAAPDKRFFSMTSMLLCDYKRCQLFRQPMTIRAKTIIYGGVLSGVVHNDVLTRHPEFEREEEAIIYLKKQLKPQSAN